MRFTINNGMTALKLMYIVIILDDDSRDINNNNDNYIDGNLDKFP